MSRRVEVMLSLHLLLSFALVSCASTSLKTSWKDESHQGSIRKVLIIGVFGNDAARRLCEIEFARQLRNAGVEAAMSYQLFPDKTLLEKDAVSARIAGTDYDAILIAKLLGKKEVSTRIPAQDRSWHSHYRMSYGYVHGPEYVVEGTVTTLEVSVFDASSEKLIWSALSETSIGDSVDRLMKEFVSMITDRMSRDGLI